MKKKVPNPNGKKGCPEHQNKIKEEKKQLEINNFEVKTEYKVENDEKCRYADLAAFDASGQLTEIVQVGISTKKGDPVAREKHAIADIEKATGTKVKFVAYKILGIAIILFITLGICRLCLL